MPDEILTPPVSTPATTPAAPAPQPAPQPAVPAPRMYTEQELAERVNSAAAAARREAEGKSKPASPAPQQPPKSDPVPTVAGVAAEDVARLVAFETGLIRHSVSGDVESKVRTLYAVEKPENVSDWLAKTVKLFGGASVPNPPNPAAPAAVAPQAPSVPAPIAPSAPSTAVPLERDIDILTMSAEQVHEFMRKKGGDPSRPYDPKNRAARREVRKAVEAALANRRIRVGAQR